MKVMRSLLIALGIFLAFITFGWIYTTAQFNIASSKGVYASPEQGMLAHAEEYYSAGRDVKIVHAGPNFFDGSQPHVWYIIAEVLATSRADGSELGTTAAMDQVRFTCKPGKAGYMSLKVPSRPSSGFG